MENAKGTIDKRDHDSRQWKVMQWLSAPDSSINQNKALQQRHEGSGEWVLQREEFVEWKTRLNSILWLHGIPGCGKTILSSTIVEHLERTILPSQSLLYFYFDFGDINKQTLHNMIRSLIHQLYHRLDVTQVQLDSLFSSCRNGCEQPKIESLCEILKHSIEHVDRVWIVLDALDECKTREGNSSEGLLSWIKGLLNSELRNVHLLVTSRPEQDIKAALEVLMHNESISLQSEHLSGDIQAYIRARVRGDEKFKRWRGQPKVQNEIETQLAEKAHGM